MQAVVAAMAPKLYKHEDEVAVTIMETHLVSAAAGIRCGLEELHGFYEKLIHSHSRVLNRRKDSYMPIYIDVLRKFAKEPELLEHVWKRACSLTGDYGHLESVRQYWLEFADCIELYDNLPEV